MDDNMIPMWKVAKGLKVTVGIVREWASELGLLCVKDDSEFPWHWMRRGDVSLLPGSQHLTNMWAQ